MGALPFCLLFPEELLLEVESLLAPGGSPLGPTSDLCPGTGLSCTLMLSFLAASMRSSMGSVARLWSVGVASPSESSLF